MQRVSRQRLPLVHQRKADSGPTAKPTAMAAQSSGTAPAEPGWLSARDAGITALSIEAAQNLFYKTCQQIITLLLAQTSNALNVRPPTRSSFGRALKERWTSLGARNVMRSWSNGKTWLRDPTSLKRSKRSSLTDRQPLLGIVPCRNCFCLPAHTGCARTGWHKFPCLPERIISGIANDCRCPGRNV
jgi:hypothetical protein